MNPPLEVESSGLDAGILFQHMRPPEEACLLYFTLNIVEFIAVAVHQTLFWLLTIENNVQAHPILPSGEVWFYLIVLRYFPWCNGVQVEL